MTVQLNSVLNGAIHYTRDTHEWITQLTMRQAHSKTPAISTWIKTQDEINASLLYLYGLPQLNWFGPFGRLRLQSALLPGLFLSDSAVDLRLKSPTRPDRIVSLEIEEPFQLTSSFEPLVTRESMGLFARPLNSQRRWLILSLGFGYQQINTDEGWAINDFEETPEIELYPLQSTEQAGFELGLEAAGAWSEVVGWSGHISLLYPILGDGDTGERSAAGLNSEVAAQVSLKLAAWFSLDYRFSGRRIPLLVDDWQLFHGLLFTSSFALLGTPPSNVQKPKLHQRNPIKLPESLPEAPKTPSAKSPTSNERLGVPFLDLLFSGESQGSVTPSASEEPKPAESPAQD